MKKKLLFISAILFSTLLASQAVIQTWSLVGSATNLISYPTRINSISLNAGSNIGNVNYWFFDGYATNASRPPASGWRLGNDVIGAYTNTTSYATNWAVMYTNMYGGTNVKIYTNIIYTLKQTVAASSNRYTVIAQGTAGSNSLITITFATPYIASKGVNLTNWLWFTNTVVPAYVTIDHSPLL